MTGGNNYRIASSRALLLRHLSAIHAFLTQSYWAEGIPKNIVRKSMRNSLCFGVLQGKELVAFCRVISDKATYAYLADVFVLEEHRGKGLSKRMMDAVKAHKELQNIRRFMLVTRDAHELYAKYGFKALSNPDRHMELLNRDIYKKHRK
jgi:N-acetylglutamate synthase-like GNAT family acetyltransferase